MKVTSLCCRLERQFHSHSIRTQKRIVQYREGLSFQHSSWCLISQHWCTWSNTLSFFLILRNIERRRPRSFLQSKGRYSTKPLPMSLHLWFICSTQPDASRWHWSQPSPFQQRERIAPKWFACQGHMILCTILLSLSSLHYSMSEIYLHHY